MKRTEPLRYNYGAQFENHYCGVIGRYIDSNMKSNGSGNLDGMNSRRFCKLAIPQICTQTVCLTMS